MSKKDRGVDPHGGQFPPHEVGTPWTPPTDAEVIADLEQKLAVMVDERLASLARRVDLLYRYTVGDRTGRHTLVPNMHQRGAEFPEAEP